ncbi:MAG TPA: DUF892 family protein [Vicinamibacterales bacterium]|nr:DUF892 family protein [Vicinamibacterales bacterium]
MPNIASRRRCPRCAKPRDPHAELLGNDEVASLLQETLDEESAANEKLTAIAETGINEAAGEDEEIAEPRPQRWAAAVRGGASSRRTSSGRAAKKGAKKK